MQDSFIISLLKEITPDFDIKVVSFPNNISSGFLVLPDGRRHYFKSARWDVNPLGGSRVVNDKSTTIELLNDFKYSVPNGVVLKDLDLKLLENLNLPLVIKPNSECQARGLTYIENSAQIEKAYLYANSFDKTVRVEEEVKGKHACVGIFNGKVYFAYEKKPFSAGDIVSDFTNLLSDETKSYLAKIPDLFNLKFASIDCVYTGGDDFSQSDKFVIIEVNAAPSFRKYGESSSEARENVKLLYADMIKFILEGK